MGNRRYVGNLAFNTNEEALSSAFSRFGEAEIRIVMDRDTGRSRGFAFVSMSDANAARTALAQLDGTMLDGRALRVKEAEERNAGGPRSSGGRSRW